MIIGTPAIYGDTSNTDKTGYVAKCEAQEGVFTLGANGLEPETHSITIAWDDKSITTVSEGIASDWIDRAARLNVEAITPDAAATMLEQAETATAERHDIERTKREEQAQRVSEWRDSIRDKVPTWAKAVIIAELEEDDSDTMTDYFNTKTTKTVILGFSKHTRDLFPEMRKAALNYERTANLADAPPSAEHRQKYSMGGGYFLKASGTYSSGWKISKQTFYNRGNDVAECVPYGEWAVADTPTKQATSTAPTAGGVTIEEHTHTKKGFQMWIVCLADRVDRDTYTALLDTARASRGWYSRKWGNTPAGFAFKDQDAATAFAASIQDTAAPIGEPTNTADRREATADKLESLADKMQSEIDGKFGSRAENTPKQRCQAGRARQDGRDLERAQKGLRILAALHREDNAPQLLLKVTSKKAALDLARENLDHSNSGYYDTGRPTGEPAQDTNAARAFWALAGPKTPEEIKRDKIEALESKIKNSTIAGFFPTPAPVVAKMIQRADIRAGHSVLEPSAGSGAIMDAMKEHQPEAKIRGFECNSNLIELLSLKGHLANHQDFLTSCPVLPTYDRVLMNPPFEKGQDIEHVKHAFTNHLKAGGVLVAIMSPSWQHNQARKFADFREWLEELPHYVETLDAGTFRESGTNVSTVIVTIERNEIAIEALIEGAE